MIDGFTEKKWMIFFCPVDFSDKDMNSSPPLLKKKDDKKSGRDFTNLSLPDHVLCGEEFIVHVSCRRGVHGDGAAAGQGDNGGGAAADSDGSPGAASPQQAEVGPLQPDL